MKRSGSLTVCCLTKMHSLHRQTTQPLCPVPISLPLLGKVTNAKSTFLYVTGAGYLLHAGDCGIFEALRFGIWVEEVDVDEDWSEWGNV